MKLGFLCPNIPGHLNPMTALARHLQARNHEVVFLYSTTAAGLPFVPAPENDHFNESITEMNKLITVLTAGASNNRDAADYSGLMFWLTWKKLFGSYFLFTSVSRS